MGRKGELSVLFSCLDQHSLGSEQTNVMLPPNSMLMQVVFPVCRHHLGSGFFSLALGTKRGKERDGLRRMARASGQSVVLADLHQRTLTWPVHDASRRVQQILLLGAGESGKSTFAKQLNLLTKGKLADSEISLYRRGGWQQDLPK